MKKLHAFASIISFLCIAVFLISTIIVDLFCSHETIARLKSLIVLPGLIILIPAMAITGATGFKISRGRKGKIIDKKKKRMPFIALIGVLIMIPSAILLDMWASTGQFGVKFLLVQLIEIICGSFNLFLMSMSMRDGFVLTGKLKINR
ncbi:hypothetical protein [Paenibacillus sp. JNUCC-31]|uniref:hypothetical protein n=1 Tax=unclassified Paenibacillus TaxID=185978 RepID=UPI0017840240|nr:hypothetical protein [Paenibacillus sp. JNUCC-31]QOS79375.1 hypothetical protein JNUCC31_32865 [Paenibacillus sp. JNUCC-31]